MVIKLQSRSGTRQSQIYTSAEVYLSKASLTVRACPLSDGCTLRPYNALSSLPIHVHRRWVSLFTGSRCPSPAMAGVLGVVLLLGGGGGHQQDWSEVLCSSSLAAQLDVVLML